MSVALCPWDDGASDSEEDDWLFSSLTRYNQLLMFHLTVQPQCVALAPGGNTFVVGVPPSKLVAGSKEKEDLTSNRDFGLVAGTVQAGHVRGVQFMGQEKLVSCKEGLEGVEVWGWGEEDLIERKGVMDKCGFEPGILHVDGEECYVGGLDTVGRVGEEKWSCRKVEGKGEVCSLYRDTEGRGVWVGQRDGLVSCVDWRVEGVASELRLSGTDSRRWDTAFLGQSAGVCVARVMSAGGGCVALSDTRQSVHAH